MKKVALILFALLISASTIFAQKPYNNSVGGVVGFIEGFSYKGFPMDNFAIQADAGYSVWNYHIGSSLKANANFMYEGNIGKGWHWFAGGGISLGLCFWKDGYWRHSDWHYYHPVYFGINAIGGAEYKFANIPLTLQADVRPGVFFYTHKYNTWNINYDEKVHTELVPAFDCNLVQISARYTF